MYLRITPSNLKSDKKSNFKSFKEIFRNRSFLIEGDNLLKKWNNKNGDCFFLLGDIIGFREKNNCLSKITDFSVLEEQKNLNKVEGRFIIVQLCENGDLNLWTDIFGRIDVYWIKTEDFFCITSSLNLIPGFLDKGKINNVGLAQCLTIYGSRPIKKHTLLENVSRLGVQEKLIFSNFKFKINKINFKSKSSFLKDDKNKLNEYSDFFIESVRSRASKSGNIIFLSSGWDSTSILAVLVHLFGPSKVKCVIGRMKYSKRSGIINQFELDRAKKIADYYNVELHTVELDYTEKIETLIKEVSPILKSQMFSNLTGFNHWLLAKGAKEIAKKGEVVFAGEISDGAHNLGFSQFFSIYHPASHSFREYSDKMASYLFGPTFLSQLINNEYENDPVWKIFKTYNHKTNFDKLKLNKNDITHQLLSTFFLSGGRMPLYSKSNSKFLTKYGALKFMNESENIYLKEFYGKINENNLYSYYLHLYNSFHWQGGTVATLEYLCEENGLKCRMPFLDKSLIDFLSEMPESWGRGLDINNTKFPLKWMLKNKVDYPFSLQEGPHSYLYDIEPSFSHSREIVEASSFTPIFIDILKRKNFYKRFDSKIFNINYINQLTKKYISRDKLKVSEINDILNLSMYALIDY
tara:strand:+ start:15366 stop:17270 length:1905 start_codon:yes stop_codon:yes gene_type:complete